jgi:flagellar basal-body rod protein FlgB
MTPRTGESSTPPSRELDPRTDWHMISDLTTRTLQASLWGLDARRRAGEDNVANVETPGFRGSVVSFEASLREAVEQGDPTSVSVERAASAAPTRLNGNNVNIGDELTGMTETALNHQMVISALNAKYRGLRTAMG